MNWKEEAIARLQRYPVMLHAVQLIPRELERLELEARALQSGAGRGRGKRNLRAAENQLLDNMVRRQELEQQQMNAECWVDTTGQALMFLTDRERKLLEMLYMEGADTARVCDTLQLERSSMYRHRDAALKKLTLAMYGALES